MDRSRGHSSRNEHCIRRGRPLAADHAPTNLAGANNFVGNQTNALNLSTLTTKIDHIFDAHNRITYRYILHNFPTNNTPVFAEPAADPFGVETDRRAYSNRWNYIHNFSSTAINDFRFNWQPRRCKLLTLGRVLAGWTAGNFASLQASVPLKVGQQSGSIWDASQRQHLTWNSDPGGSVYNRLTAWFSKTASQRPLTNELSAASCMLGYRGPGAANVDFMVPSSSLCRKASTCSSAANS